MSERRARRFLPDGVIWGLNRSRSLYEILQILGLNLFEKTPLYFAITLAPRPSEQPVDGNQRILFD